MIANMFTASRILFSLCLFVLPASSTMFAELYLLCGVTDVLDGFLARRHRTESKAGERLDSIADLFFAGAYAVKILPLLRLPGWIWTWTILISIGKILGIIKRSKKEQNFYVAHSFANKLTGLLIFLLPMTALLSDVEYSAVVVCTGATFAAAEDLLSRKIDY
ncbi:MAG: CDP-alcohol phosphatidyltransferase family protein [Eubacteriales bacterium]|nr:CDP-alcohol phosphatidyltransferase family protein [Eubacteriales bacterium]